MTMLVTSLVLVLVATSLVAGLGAPRPVDVETLDERQQSIVNFALVQLQGGEHGPCRRESKIENFSEQTVAGTLYKFDMVLQHGESRPEECGVPTDPRSEVCHMVVWDKPWEQYREVQWEQVKCDREEEVEEPEEEVEEPEKVVAAPTGLLRVALTKAVAPLRVGLVLPEVPQQLDEGHDQAPQLLGEDGHDQAPHGEAERPRKVLLGSGPHDFLPHGKRGGGMVGGQVPHGPQFDAEYTKGQLLKEEESKKQLKKLQSLGAFHDFMTEHNKSYVSKAEYKKRYAVFRDNMKKVQFLTETEQGTGEYGATAMADLTETEFKTHFLGWNKLMHHRDVHWPAAEIPDVELPVEFDWRDRGAVTVVKNQGPCGSCWAFSVCGNVEGLNAIKHGELLNLSEQELVDCDTRDSGCNGGLPENAYKTLMEIGGLELESDYGYDGEDERCQFDRSKVAVRVTGGLEISENETQIAQWLHENGPISVGLNAAAMQFYRGGISHPWSFLCSADGIDHGVLIVGFGEHEYPLFHQNMPYWIIKNSWGPRWGEQGYYRLYRGDGACGINMMTSSAIIE